MNPSSTTTPTPVVDALHQLRIGGSRMHAELVAAVGAETVDSLLAAELIKRAGSRVMLTATGRATHEQALAEQLDAGLRTIVADGYQRFLPLNAEVLQLCTDWQIRTDGPSPVPNDHRDAGYDAAIVERLGTVSGAAQPLVAHLGAALARFAPYGEDLAQAVERVRSGATDYLTNPRVRCFHTVWFELHEDLLATLGIERTSEEGQP